MQGRSLPPLSVSKAELLGLSELVEGGHKSLGAMSFMRDQSSGLP